MLFKSMISFDFQFPVLRHQIVATMKSLDFVGIGFVSGNVAVCQHLIGAGLIKGKVNSLLFAESQKVINLGCSCELSTCVQVEYRIVANLVGIDDPLVLWLNINRAGKASSELRKKGFAASL